MSDSITTIDIKTTNTPHTHLAPNGARVIDLDGLLAGHLRHESGHTIDAHPANVVTVTEDAQWLLAGSPRQHADVLTGQVFTVYDYFEVGGWDEDNYVRTEYAGPLVQGPGMFAYKRTVIIDSQIGSPKTALLVQAGDLAGFLGATFEVQFPQHQNGHMKLHLLSDSPVHGLATA